MTPSKSEELLAICWFILATQLPTGRLKSFIIGVGFAGLVASMILAI